MINVFHSQYTPHILLLHKEDQGQQAMNKFSLRYDDVETAGSVARSAQNAPKNSTQPHVSKAQSHISHTDPAPNPPPLVNPQLFSTNPVHASAFLMAAAASGQYTGHRSR